MSVSPDRSAAGRLGALVQQSRNDPKVYTAKARARFLERFYADLDPSLPDAEKHRRAEAALKAHMLRLAMLSAKARRKKAATPTGDEAA